MSNPQMTIHEPQMRAFALGYYHGRAIGNTDGNPFTEGDSMSYFYKLGYDLGVADYCDEEQI